MPGTSSNTNCPNGYFRNSLGKCEANPTNNCPTGFFLNSLGNCELIDSSTTIASLPNCQDGFFRNIYGNCEAVNPLCKTYNLINGFCTSCYNGYTLNQGSCLVNIPTSIPPFSIGTQVTNRGTIITNTPI